MSEAQLYFRLGFFHIADWYSYDHLLFLLTLAAVYTIGSARNLLYVITGFTLGHTFTLALSAYGIVHLPEKLVEILIPLTIVFTAVYNLRLLWQDWSIKRVKNTRIYQETHSRKHFPWARIAIAAGFGCIHGLGFGADFQALTMGFSDTFIVPLGWFTLGIEVGQLVVISILLFSCWVSCLAIAHKYWVAIVSGTAMLLALGLLWTRV